MSALPAITIASAILALTALLIALLERRARRVCATRIAAGLAEIERFNTRFEAHPLGLDCYPKGRESDGGFSTANAVLRQVEG